MGFGDRPGMLLGKSLVRRLEQRGLVVKIGLGAGGIEVVDALGRVGDHERRVLGAQEAGYGAVSARAVVTIRAAVDADKVGQLRARLSQLCRTDAAQARKGFRANLAIAAV